MLERVLEIILTDAGSVLLTNHNKQYEDKILKLEIDAIGLEVEAAEAFDKMNALRKSCHTSNKEVESLRTQLAKAKDDLTVMQRENKELVKELTRLHNVIANTDRGTDEIAGKFDAIRAIVDQKSWTPLIKRATIPTRRTMDPKPKHSQKCEVTEMPLSDQGACSLQLMASNDCNASRMDAEWVVEKPGSTDAGNVIMDCITQNEFAIHLRCLPEALTKHLIEEHLAGLKVGRDVYVNRCGKFGFIHTTENQAKILIKQRWLTTTGGIRYQMVRSNKTYNRK